MTNSKNEGTSESLMPEKGNLEGEHATGTEPTNRSKTVVDKRKFRAKEDGEEEDADEVNGKNRTGKVHIPGNLRVLPGDSELTKISKAISYKLCMKYYQDLRTLAIVAFFFYLQYIRWVNFGKFTVPFDLWMLFLNCIFGFFCATIVHNCVHVHMFTYTWINTLWQIVLTNTYGYPVSMLIPGHNLSHHRYTQTEYDIHHTFKMKWRWHVMNFFGFWIQSLPAVMESDPMYFREARMRGESLMCFRVTLEQIGYWPLQLVLMYTDFSRWLWIFFIPQFFAKWALVSINMYQHDGCPAPEAQRNAKDGTDRWDPMFNSARDFTGTALNFFTCNNGYHSIHHLRPSCHWSRYPELWKELVVPNQHPNLRQKCICWYVIKTFWLPSWIPGCGRKWFDGRDYFPDEEGLGGYPGTYKDWVSRHFSEIAKGSFMD